MLEGGAAHSNTRGKRNELRNSSLWIAQGAQRVKGAKEIEETEDVTWGPRDSQVLPKYEEIKGSPLRG